MECELIQNEAGGKKFTYCRTHKVEPHQCPRPEPVNQPLPSWTQPHITDYKRAFKVGDRVKCIDNIVLQLGVSLSGLLVGAIYEVLEINNSTDEIRLPNVGWCKARRFILEQRTTSPSKFTVGQTLVDASGFKYTVQQVDLTHKVYTIADDFGDPSDLPFIYAELNLKSV